MSYTTSLGKYNDSSDGAASINGSFWMTTELPRPGYSKISCNEDQGALKPGFHKANFDHDNDQF